MKRLFEVNIDNTIYVMAEDRHEAIKISKESLSDEVPDNFEFYSTPVISSSNIICGWEDSLPYGGDNNKTCAEILGEIKEAEEIKKDKAEADKKQLKLGL